MSRYLPWLALLPFLGACSFHSQQPLYHWGGYQHAVYDGLRGKTSPDEQIAELEAYLEKAKSENRDVAPGVYAQLGVLYVKTGHADRAREAFTAEKTLFPESATFMDFLLKNKRGK